MTRWKGERERDFTAFSFPWSSGTQKRYQSSLRPREVITSGHYRPFARCRHFTTITRTPGAGFLFLVIMYTSKVHAYRFEVPHPRMCLWMTDLWKHLDIGPVCREFFAADNGLLNKWLTENNLASYKNLKKVKPKSNSHFFECVFDTRDWSFLDRFLLINALGIKGVNPVFGPSMRQLRLYILIVSLH